MGMAAFSVVNLSPDPLTISIDPQNISKIYTPNSAVIIPIQFSICKYTSTDSYYALYPSGDWFLYSVDNHQNVTANPGIVSRYITAVTSDFGGPTQNETTNYTVTLNIGELPEGRHKITVYLGEAIFTDETHLLWCGGYHRVDSLYFVVGGLSIIKVESPKNATYQTANIPLNFNAEHVSQVTYSIDGQDNVTVSGNTTLSGLPNGSHNISFYAVDAGGYWTASQTVSYEIANFQLVPIALAVSAIVASAGISLLYFKRHKRKPESPS